MTDSKNFWGFSRNRLKTLLELEFRTYDRPPASADTKQRIRLGRLTRTVDFTGQVVDFESAIIAPVVMSELSAPVFDDLIGRTRVLSEKASRGYEQNADDGDGDGKIQDNTPWERPAPAGKIPSRSRKKPKRGERADRTNKPKRRRLIDAIRNLGQRREGDSAQERALEVSPRAVQPAGPPEDFSDDERRGIEDLIAQLEQMLRESDSEQNEQSPEDVVREIEEMFDDIDREMRAQREQEDRAMDERRIAREEASRQDLEEQAEPLSFEAGMPSNGHGPSTLADPEDQNFVRYRLRNIELSDEELDALAAAPTARLNEHIRELRERSRRALEQASDASNYTSEYMASQGFDYAPDLARSVDYSIGYYQRLVADYLADRLALRGDSDNG